MSRGEADFKTVHVQERELDVERVRAPLLQQLHELDLFLLRFRQIDTGHHHAPPPLGGGSHQAWSLGNLSGGRGEFAFLQEELEDLSGEDVSYLGGLVASPLPDVARRHQILFLIGVQVLGCRVYPVWG